MPPIDTHQEARLLGKHRRRQSDPWLASQSAQSNEQAPWLLSYLDVMTLLFSFFVMLFAYEKAQTNQRAHLIASSVSAKALNVQSKTPGTELAIASMKAQSEMGQLRKNGSNDPLETEETRVPHSFTPSFDLLAHVGHTIMPTANASELVTTKLSSVLLDETNKRFVEIDRSAAEVRIDIKDEILFDSGSATLNPKGEKILLRVIPALTINAGRISVEGHTDSTHIGNRIYPSNWELSAARASAVTRFLVAGGIDAKRLRAIGMAEMHPRDTNMTPDGRAKNRRVTLTIQTDREST